MLIRAAIVLGILVLVVPLCFADGEQGRDLTNELSLHERAEQGEANAQFDLGYAYYTGKGFPVNYAEAMKWFLKSAGQGFAAPQINLGVMYHNGEGVPVDYKEAMKWYRKAAEQGNTTAQNNLGLMYCNGEGVPANYTKGYVWLSFASAQGDEDAKKTSISYLKI